MASLAAEMVKNSSTEVLEAAVTSVFQPGKLAVEAIQVDHNAKMEQEKLAKVARKGPSTGEQAPATPSSAASDVKAGSAGPTASSSTGVSTDKNRNYAVLAGTLAGLSALGWYFLSKEPKKKEEVLD